MIIRIKGSVDGALHRLIRRPLVMLQQLAQPLTTRDRHAEATSVDVAEAPKQASVFRLTVRR